MTAFCDGCDTNKSPFEANSIIRALATLSAYNSTLKPDGTLGTAPSGLSTTLPKFGRGSLGGTNATLCWANVATDAVTIPTPIDFMSQLFIGHSTFFLLRPIS
jgi:hypothetical protein